LSTSGADTVPARELERLRERAGQFGSARKVEEQGEQYELLRFTLAQEHYAIEIGHVEEVCPFHRITPIPCTPPYLLGAASWRGRVLAVVDLKKFFGLPEKGLVTLNRVLVLSNGTMEFGLLADEVLGLERLPVNGVQPPVATLTGIRADYLLGIGPRSLVVLDGAALLADERLIVKEDVSAR
jgi:purine-binding chemotaxis protein CheW